MIKHLALLLAPLALALPAPAQSEAARPSPSFSCAATTTAAERAICASPELSREDALMARLYTLVAADRRAKGLSDAARDQREWLAERGTCEKPKLDVYKSREECLVSRYRSRNIELAVEALFLDRELAFATLRRLDPMNAPFVQALVLFSKAPPGSNWNSPALAAQRREVEGLLAEPLAVFLAGENTGYGKSILEDGGPITLTRAFASDDGFARMVGIMATYSEGEMTPAQFPCEVLLRNPALTGATGPYFGSTLDNFTPRSTCGTNAPKLKAMLDTLWHNWPQCEGTIRFSAYRGFANQIDAAVIGYPRTTRLSRKAFPRRAGVSAAMVNSVIAELTGYYQTYRAMDAVTARATAQERTRALLEGAHDCGG